MWDCLNCGCRSIAASLTFCPVCRKDHDDMPKSTAGGASNANALPGETGYVEPEETPEPEPVLEAEAAPEPAPEPETPEPVKPAETVPAPPAPPVAPKPAIPAIPGPKAAPAKAADGPAEA